MRYKLGSVVIALGLTGTLAGAAFAVTKATRQSPINIKTASAVQRKAAPIELNLSTSATLDVLNTWDPAGSLKREWGTVKVNVPAGSTAVLNGETYDLLQFHFHTPSEHAVNGKRTAMEMHFVFLKQGLKPCDHSPDALLVIGTEIVAGKSNTELARIFDSPLPVDKTAAHLKIENFDLTKVLPEVGPTWRYSGSLTAPASFSPTCDEPEGPTDQQLISGDFPENVQWVVRQRKVTLSEDEIARFRALFPEGNARPLQPLNDRTVVSARG